MTYTSGHIARSAVWNHIGKVAEYGLIYVASVVVARSLGVVENGRYAGIISLVQLLLVFGSFGIETALNTFIPQLSGPRASAQARFLIRNAVAARLGLLILLSLPVVLVCRLLPATPLVVVEYLWIMLGLAAARGIASIMSTVLAALLKTSVTAAVNTFARFGELAAILYLALSGTSIYAVLAVMLAGAILQSVGYLVAASKQWVGEVEPVPLRPVLVFGGIFWVNTLADFFLGRQGDILLLTLLMRDSGQASIYDVAYSLLQAGTMLMTAGVSGVSLATFARLAAESEESLRDFYGLMVRILSLLTIPTMAFMLVFAGDIVPLLYSSRFTGAVSTLQVLLGMRIVSRLFGWGENAEYLLAMKKPGTVISIGLMGAGATVLMHLLLIPRYGAVGAAVGAGLGSLLANVAGYSRVRAMSERRLQVRVWLVLAIGSLGVAFLTGLLPLGGGDALELVGRLVAFLLIFLGFLWIAHPLSADDLRGFPGARAGFQLLHRIRNGILDTAMHSRDPLLPDASTEETSRADQLRSELSSTRRPELTPRWQGLIDELREGLLNRDPREFLRLPVVRRVMFATNADYVDREFDELKKSPDWAKVWKSAIRESNTGRPTRYWRDRTTSGNLIHQAYQLHRLYQMSGFEARSIDTVYEFGGGYGAFCLLMRRIAFTGEYNILDVPEMSALQRYYLDGVASGSDMGNVHGRPVQVNTIQPDDVQKELARGNARFGRTLFVGLWSLSEAPLELRRRIMPLVAASGHVLLVYQEQFDGIDNVRYFKEIRQLLNDREWIEEPIYHQPGNRRLVARPINARGS